MRTLLRLLLRLALLLLVLALLAAAIGPLLISPNPAPGTGSAARVAPAASRFIEVPRGAGGSVQLHYLARAGAAGDAPAAPPQQAFVLLHGFTFNAFTWSTLLDLFARYAPVVAYDQIPYGLSAKPLPAADGAEDVYSRAAALERLFALIDALGLRQVILVGNSSGGTLALEAARARPGRVAGLILISPWVHSERPILPDWLVGLPQVDRLTLLLARYLGNTSPLLDYSYADPSRITDERRALSGAHRLIAGWDLAWGALLQRSLTDPVEIAGALGAIEQPVLVLTGDADEVVPVADTRATAEALPNAMLQVLPGCGHLAQEECPAAVKAAARPWLEAHAFDERPAPGR